MRSFLISVCLVSATNIQPAWPQDCDSASSAEEGKAEILQIFEIFRVASLNGDIDTILRHFHPDVRVFHAGETVVNGRADLETLARQAARQSRLDIRSEVQDIEIYNDRAHVIGEYWHTITDRETGQITYKPGRFLLLMKKSPQCVWQIYRDMDQMSSPEWRARQIRSEDEMPSPGHCDKPWVSAAGGSGSGCFDIQCCSRNGRKLIPQR